MKRIARTVDPLIVVDIMQMPICGRLRGCKVIVELLPLTGQIKVIAGIDTEIVLN